MISDSQSEYWNSAAEKKTFTHPVNIPLLGKWVHEESVIVDYGCGYGRVVDILRQNGFRNVAGFDTSEALIGRGIAAGIPGLFHIDSGGLPLADNSVDCFILFAVLTCIPSNKAQSDLLSLLFKKLKPGGIVYISDYYLQSNTEEVSRYQYLDDDKDNYGVFTLPEGATFRHHTREWIISLLCDFVIRNEQLIQVTTMNGHNASAFQLIAQKP